MHFDHGGRRICAVNGLSYALTVGRTLALIGESGSGKTVSSRAIMGLLPPTATASGSVRFEGQELLGLSDKAMRRHRGADIAMVFQDPSRSLNPTMRIGAQVAEAVRTHARVDRAGRARPGARAAEARAAALAAAAPAASTPTSSRAGCASAWSSRSRWPPSPGC